jgi:hypothetical protein
MPRRAPSAGESRLAPPHFQRRQDGMASLKNRLVGSEHDNEPESVKRYRQFLAGACPRAPGACVGAPRRAACRLYARMHTGSTMPPDLRSAATGDIDSSILQTSTNRLLLQSWLPDGGSAHMLVQKSPAQGVRSLALAANAARALAVHHHLVPTILTSALCAGLAPQLPLSTPGSFAEDEATGRHRFACAADCEPAQALADCMCSCVGHMGWPCVGVYA